MYLTTASLTFFVAVTASERKLEISCCFPLLLPICHRGCFYVILVNGNAVNYFFVVLPPPDDRFPLKIGKSVMNMQEIKIMWKGPHLKAFLW